MTYLSGRSAGGLAASGPARAAARARPLPPGFGLAIGAVASLGLWAGLTHLALRLLG